MDIFLFLILKNFFGTVLVFFWRYSHTIRHPLSSRSEGRVLGMDVLAALIKLVALITYVS
jgi:hypothetical protein